MLVAIAVPFVIPLFVPILAVFWWVRRRYVTTSREVKRFEGHHPLACLCLLFRRAEGTPFFAPHSKVWCACLVEQLCSMRYNKVR